MDKIAGVILAAGKGKRINSKDVNKVALMLNGKQMVLHSTGKLTALGIKSIIVVVGFAKESIVKILDKKAIAVNQTKRLGTAHAVMTALKKVPKTITTVLVINGDDSAFYPISLLKKIIKSHLSGRSSVSFLTITVSNPAGLGRIVRGKDGNIVKIVEDKELAGRERNIKETNPGCYIFEVSFLKKYLKHVKKSKTSGEYYLTSLIDIAIKNNESLNDVKAGFIPWRGINTHEELKEAEKLLRKTKRYENYNISA